MAGNSASLAKKLVELRDNYGRSSSSTAVNDKMAGSISEHFKVQKSGQNKTVCASKSATSKATDAGKSTTAARDIAELEILRQFDLDATYGPCAGISRMERWNRATKFGFHPPTDVHDIILNHATDDKYTQSVWLGVNI